MAPKRRLGETKPRVFTPPLRELTPETSEGFKVIRFAEEVLRITLYPWQRWLLIHALELLPSGEFRFRYVVVLVARQNGKSTLGQILALYFLYVMRVPLVLGTAQNLDISSELWRETVDIAEAIPELADEIDDVTRQVSRESLMLHGRRQYRVAAASRKGGRGRTGDLILMDELREHLNWHAWSAVSNTTMARQMALVWAMSNAGDSTSVVLRSLRFKAHEILGDPDGIVEELEANDGDLDDEGESDTAEGNQGDHLGWFEWSAPPNCDIWDRGAWAMANPSMNYGGLSDRNIEAAMAGDEWEFRTEILCQWRDDGPKGPFKSGRWTAGTVYDAPSEVDEITLGVDVDVNRTKAHIAAAYIGADGRPQVSLEASRPGLDWIEGWLSDRVSLERPMRIALQGRGAPVSTMFDDLSRIEGLEVVRWQGEELANGTALIFDHVNKLIDLGGDEPVSGLAHMPAPALDVAAVRARARLLSGGGLAWDRVRSPGDISPLVAATAALWLLLRPEAIARVSAYDSGARLMVV